jgi:hypothetical protein
MAGPRKPSHMQANTHRAKLAAKTEVDTVNLPGITDSCPPGKSKEWQDIFDHTVKSCEAMGIDAFSDLPGVYEFCEIHCEVMRLKRSLIGPDGEEQYTVLSKKGEEMLNPNYTALLRLRPLYHKLLGDFGMTPRGRAYMYDKRKTEKGKVSTLMDMLNDSE